MALKVCSLKYFEQCIYMYVVSRTLTLHFSRKKVDVLSEHKDEETGLIFTEFEVTDELPYVGDLTYRVERIADPTNGTIDMATFPMGGLIHSMSHCLAS